MRKLCTIILLLLASQLIYGQDVEFSQYYANPLYLNPAFAGSEDYTRIALNYKSLLPSSYGSYSNYSASVDKYFDGLSGGLGFQIMDDRQLQGVINNLGFNLIYSYQANLNRDWVLSTGFRIGYNMITLNATNLVLPDMLDGTSSTSNATGLYQQSLYFDFSAGMLTWFKNYYLGLSVDHLTKPQISLGSDDPGPIDRKYTVHGGMEIPFYNMIYRVNMTVSPNFIYQQQGSSSKLNLGVYVNRNYFTTGLWLKTNSQFNLVGTVIMLGLISDYTIFAYSYDIPFYKGGFDGIINGAHEVTFMYKFKYKRKRKMIKAIKCPKI